MSFLSIRGGGLQLAGAAAVFALAARPAPASGPRTPVLAIDAAAVTAQVTPTFYGLMTEEINYSYDGGLYGELIRNRSFRDDPDGPVDWSVVQDQGGAGFISLDPAPSLHASGQAASLRLEVRRALPGQRVGVANGGYWGIPLEAGRAYRATVYARGPRADGAEGKSAGPLTVSLENADGTVIFATADLPELTADWQPYTVTLTPAQSAPTAANRLVISAHHVGSAWLQMVSLFPPTWHDRPNGNRIDLMQKLADLHPTFLRFPGGNYLEGDTFAERFDWKKTLGEVAARPGHRSPWGYRSTDGMGLLEFLEWCEDLKMQPVLAVFAGYALRHEYLEAGPRLQPFVQDALDEIEYVTGDASTTWGARRIQDGHPAPFPLTYVEIGNEDQFDKSGSYEGRYAQFYDAIKAKYPALQLIATTKVKSRRPDVVDEHYYRRAQQFYNDVHHYDGYDRTGPKIFVGEWATREGAPTPNMNAALGDAAWLTGLERNSDIVIMNSYAPLLVNVNPGGMQWKTDLIGYDARTSYGSPPYYAQGLFSAHHGDTVVAATLDAGKDVFFSVTRDHRTGLITVKVVNTSAAPLALRVDVAGVAAIDPDGTAIVLSSASPTDTNTLAAPAQIVPVAFPLTGLSRSFTHEFPAYSLTVLLLQGR
jgi:alpha-N-arabinofuranosidase